MKNSLSASVASLGFGFLVTATVLFSAKNASACSPPRYPFIVQASALTKVLSDAGLGNEILNAGAEGIVSTAFGRNGIEVALNNGCVINARLVYKPIVSPGMCPIFDRVEYAPTQCGPTTPPRP